MNFVKRQVSPLKAALIKLAGFKILLISFLESLGSILNLDINEQLCKTIMLRTSAKKLARKCLAS